MMAAKRFSVVFVLFLILVQQKRLDAAAPYDAFSNDINTCLFSDWATAGVLKITAPDTVPIVNCASPDDVQLCYGKYGINDKALFAVCYNTNTLIPEFTGHVLQSGGTVGAPNMIDPPDLYDKRWKSDESLGQMVPARSVATDEDYKKDQKAMFPGIAAPNYDSSLHILARGHLTPNGDFQDTNSERSFTFITTNIAPQWQPFNMGNWAVLEMALFKYAKDKGRSLYIFTGTGGDQGAFYNLNGRVRTPRYYWKAVCDPNPAVKQSIVFVAENVPGELGAVKNNPGCNGQQQTAKVGVVYCYSLQGAAQEPAYNDFKLPPFTDANCNPAVKGTFLDTFLKNKFQ